MSLSWVPSALPAPVIPRSHDSTIPRFQPVISSAVLLPHSSALLPPRPTAHPRPLSSQHPSRPSQPATPVQPPRTFLLFLFIPSSGTFYFCLLFVLNALGQTSLFVFVLLAWVCSPKQATGTEMPNPSIPALETVVRSHVAQLTKLNFEHSSAFSQVTGEMGELKNSVSTTSTLTSLANQVAALTDMVAWLLQAPATEPSPTPPPVRPAASSPVVPLGEPNLPPPKPYSGEFDKCRGFLGQCQLLFLHQPSRFRSDGAKVALIISSLSDRALDWAMAAVGNNLQLSSNLQQFSDEFKKTFDHPSNGADAAGRLHSILQGSRSIAEYTLEFRTLAANSEWDDNALRSAYRRGLSEEMKDLIRDRPSSCNDFVTLALLMDERHRERRLDGAEHSGNSARTPGTRPVGPDVAAQGSTPVPPLPPSRALLSRPQGEDEPMQLGQSRLSPEVRKQLRT